MSDYTDNEDQWAQADYYAQKQAQITCEACSHLEELFKAAWTVPKWQDIYCRDLKEHREICSIYKGEKEKNQGDVDQNNPVNNSAETYANHPEWFDNDPDWR